MRSILSKPGVLWRIAIGGLITLTVISANADEYRVVRLGVQQRYSYQVPVNEHLYVADVRFIPFGLPGFPGYFVFGQANGDLQSIGRPGDYQSLGVPSSINLRNQVTGWDYHRISDTEIEERPFIWDEKQGMISLPFRGQSTAINERGDICGLWHYGSDGIPNAFLFRGAQSELIELAIGGYRFSEAFDLNDAGMVTGSASPDQAHSVRRAVLWTDGQHQFLFPAVHQETGVVEESVGYGVNNLGVVVGDSNAPSIQEPLSIAHRPFLWKNGVAREIAFLDGFSRGGSAFDINDREQVVGTVRVWSTTTQWWENRAFIWDEQRGCRDLNEMVMDWGGSSPVTLGEARKIFENGSIVATGRYPGAIYPDLFLLVPLGLGDMNCDGRMNNFDINPFLLALTDPKVYASEYPECDANRADLNRDSAIDNFDIDPFVELLAESATQINTPPTVQILGSSEVTISVGQALPLQGLYQDDGLPVNGPVWIQWDWIRLLPIEGTGSVVFSQEHQLQTTSTFTAPGRYAVRLSAHDGEFWSTLAIIYVNVIP